MKLDHGTEFVRELMGDEGKDQWLLVNPRMLIGLVGTVACYGWAFLMLGTSAFVPSAAAAGAAAGGPHLCFVLGAMAALAITWALSDFFSRRRRVQYALALVCTAAGAAGLWLALSGLWTLFSSVLLGAGFGLVYGLYGEFVCLNFHVSIKTYVLGIFCCALAACAGLLFAGAEMGFFFALVFPVVAFAAYACVFAFFHLGRQPVVDRRTSDARNRVAWRSYLATATAGMAAGFGLGCLLSTEFVHSWAYAIAEVLVVGTCAFLLVDACRKNRVNETITMRFFLPFAAVVAFPLMFAPPALKFVFAVLLLCGSLFPITCLLSAMCKHVALCDLSPIRAFSFGRLICLAGVAVGMALAFFGFSSEGMGGFTYETTSAAVVVVFMMLVIFSASFVMTEDNYPDETRIRRGADGATDEGAGSTTTGGAPIRRLEAAGEDGAEPATGEGAVARPGIFHIKCEIVARTYGLSNRQREVLGMLAKGRNADYITEKLIISSHTAKAHIYNIYQKTGVHSRQELMDLVEDTDVAAAGDMLQDILDDRA